MNTPTIIALIVIGVAVYLLFFAGAGGSDASGFFGTVWGWIKKLLDIVLFFVLGIVVLPAMLVMAVWYPIWETWLKEFGDLGKKPLRIILLVPLSIIVILSQLIMALVHPIFEGKIGTYFGRKPF